MKHGLTDEMILEREIEALENAINNPSDRADYLCDFFLNADLLLKSLKMKGTGVQDGKSQDFKVAS